MTLLCPKLAVTQLSRGRLDRRTDGRTLPFEMLLEVIGSCSLIIFMQADNCGNLKIVKYCNQLMPWWFDCMSCLPSRFTTDFLYWFYMGISQALTLPALNMAHEQLYSLYSVCISFYKHKAMVGWSLAWRIDRCKIKSPDRKNNRVPIFF